METFKKEKAEEEIQSICKDHDLEIVTNKVFLEKTNLYLVRRNRDNKEFYLKTGHINAWEMALMDIAQEIQSDLRFKTTKVEFFGDGWILEEVLEGNQINTVWDYDKNPEKLLEVTKKITDDYQKVIEIFLERKGWSDRDLLRQGQEWLLGTKEVLGRIKEWGGYIVKEYEGRFSQQELDNIWKQYEGHVNHLGARAFYWVHGNIISHHVLVKKNSKSSGIVPGYEFGLIDLDIRSRSYDDLLRSFDFIFLNSQNSEEIAEEIPQWIEKYYPNEVEMKKFEFVLRAIGNLGNEIIRAKKMDGKICPWVKGELNKKIELLLKFIRMEY